MNYETLKNFIENNISKGISLGGIEPEDILKIESELNVIIPNDYKKYLNDFGHVILYGVEINGYSKKTNYCSIIEETKKLQEHDISKKLLVLSNEGEYYVCLDVVYDNIFEYDVSAGDSFNTQKTFVEYFLIDYLWVKKVLTSNIE